MMLSQSWTSTSPPEMVDMRPEVGDTWPAEERRSCEVMSCFLRRMPAPKEKLMVELCVRRTRRVVRCRGLVRDDDISGAGEGVRHSAGYQNINKYKSICKGPKDFTWD